MVVRVGLVVPAEGGDSGWLDGAWDALERWRGAGLDPEVVVGDVTGEADTWDVIVLHGIQYLPEARRLADGTRTVILSDVPADEPQSAAEHVSDLGLTMIDWRWSLGAERAGRSAAGEVDGPIGFIAGPPVPTQQRVVAAFVRGVEAVDPHRPVTTVHLPSFLAVEHGASAGRTLVEPWGCQLIAHSADAPGTAGLAAARELGAKTYGFLTPVGDDAASLRSDITGVLDGLVRSAVARKPLPGTYACSWDAGEIRLERPSVG